jgi:hypothetical protein
MLFTKVSPARRRMWKMRFGRYKELIIQEMFALISGQTETKILITSGITALIYHTHNMARYLDLFTGRLFNFRNAKGSDINAGTSDKLIVTPLALAKSQSYCNVGLPIVYASVLSTKSALFVVSNQAIVIPTNSFFYQNRSNTIQAQLFASVNADTGLRGEICLVDLGNNAVVPNTTVQFTNTNYTTLSTNIFTIEAGKSYAIAIRRESGASNRFVYLRGATITLKLLAA